MVVVTPSLTAPPEDALPRSPPGEALLGADFNLVLVELRGRTLGLRHLGPFT
jgi:hypothetical protein